MGEMEYLRRMAEISCDTCCITIESDGKTLTHEPNCKLAALAEDNAQLQKALESIANRTCACFNDQDVNWHSDRCHKVAEMKARAREEVEEIVTTEAGDSRERGAVTIYVNGQYVATTNGDHANLIKWNIRDAMAAFAAKEVAEVQQKLDDCDLAFAHANEVIGKLESDLELATDSALLEAAGLVCEQCAKGIKFAETHPEMWWHLTANGGFINCKSRAIHERLAHGKEPKA